MIPLAASGTTHEIAHTSTVRFHQLLISLEGNERTGCLRIVSRKRKSRSAILIYKGRVVGCLYGAKQMDYQCLQQDAHKFALADLASPGNVLDAYELPEELVLAAASLFHGDVLNIDTNGTPHEMFEQALRSIAELKMPGCIVVNTGGDEMVCMIYLHEGRIIGVFSARDGWAKPTYEVAVGYLKNANRNTRVMASYLPVRDNQPQSLGFSLSGLDEPVRKPRVQQQLQAVESFATIQAESRTYSNLEPVYARKQPARQTGVNLRPAKYTASAVRSNNVFTIEP